MDINFSDLALPTNQLILIKHESVSAYHKYRSVWNLRIGDQLEEKHESHNAFDKCAIAATRNYILPATIQPSAVESLFQKKISRFAHYLIINKGQVSYSVTDAHRPRSPLVQVGL